MIAILGAKAAQSSLSSFDRFQKRLRGVVVNYFLTDQHFPKEMLLGHYYFIAISIANVQPSSIPHIH